MLPTHIVPGDPRHGVALYARQIARASGAPLAAHADGKSVHVHAHFTDRMWGASADEAADRLTALGHRHPLSITLHDLPQPSDGDGPFRRRVDCYRRVLTAARAVACNSHHEAGMLRDLATDYAGAIQVIPLPIVPGPTFIRRPAQRPEVALVGFVYPGKGHAEAIDAVARVRADCGPLSVVALGTSSPGHEPDLAALSARAMTRGVRLEVSGYLSATKLLRRCRTAAVPLAAHRHISASGSIGTWIAAGRRPLVPDSAYAREIEALRPHTIERYSAGELTSAIARAVIDPERTWLQDGAVVRPDLHDAAEAYVEWWSRKVPW